jgi:hypothetical protein
MTCIGGSDFIPCANSIRWGPWLREPYTARIKITVYGEK